jgi:hypothetical protein
MAIEMAREGLVSNVGVVLGMPPPPQNDRYTNMLHDMLACRRQHVGNIKPCWLLRCRVDVVLARRLPFGEVCWAAIEAVRRSTRWDK